MNDSSWFTIAYDYSGPAEVVFEEPHVEFFGPASVRSDEYGRPIVEITVERSMPPIREGFDLAAIQLGSKILRATCSKAIHTVIERPAHTGGPAVQGNFPCSFR